MSKLYKVTLFGKSFIIGSVSYTHLTLPTIA